MFTKARAAHQPITARRPRQRSKRLIAAPTRNGIVKIETIVVTETSPTDTSISRSYFAANMEFIAATGAEYRVGIAWGQAPKSVIKTLRYCDIIRSYRLNGINENSMRNILGLILLRSKKVRFSRVKRGCAPGRTRRIYASCGISET